jgi:hypothetical protein
MTGPINIPSEVERALAVYVGPHTARIALRTFSKEALGHGPERLTRADLPKLLEALRPMLAAFIGRAQANVVMNEIARKVEDDMKVRR